MLTLNQIKSTKNAHSLKEVIITTNDNEKLYCYIAGAGEPIIVLNGGPGLPSSYLLPQMLDLADTNLVIFYDQRATGKSTGEINEQTMQIARFVKDIAWIINHFQFEKVCLLGHSWGAFLAMSYAISYPSEVSKLILLNSTPICSEKKDSLSSSEPDLYEAMISKIMKSKAFLDHDGAGISKFYEETFKLFFCDETKISDLNLTMSDEAAVNSVLVHYYFEQTFFKHYDIREQLKSLRVPSLVIYGKENDLPAVVSQTISRHLSNSICIGLNGGHFSFIEAKEALFENIHKFLAVN